MPTTAAIPQIRNAINIWYRRLLACSMSFFLRASSSTFPPYLSSIQTLYPLSRWSLRISRARLGSSVWDLTIQIVIGAPYSYAYLADVARVGRNVMNDEIAHVDACAPAARLEPAPAAFILHVFLKCGRSFHGVPPCIFLLFAPKRVIV